MKNKVFCTFLLVVICQVCVCEETKIYLNNGKIAIYDNRLPATIKDYYNAKSLGECLNHPPLGYIKEYPFNSKVVLSWNDQNNNLEIGLGIQADNMSQYITLRQGPDGICYLDAIKAYLYLHNLFFWLDQVPYGQPCMPIDIFSLLRAHDIQGLLVLYDAKHQLAIPIRMTYEKNGVYYDPYMYMQYPVSLDKESIYPYSSHRNWQIEIMYPLGFIEDPITKTSNRTISKLINYFNLNVEKLEQ